MFDFDDAIEAGVTHNHDIVNAETCKQFFRLLVLNEEIVELIEWLGHAVPLEEMLIFTEDAADTIDLHASLMSSMEIMIPELIFDEDGDFGVGHPQE